MPFAERFVMPYHRQCLSCVARGAPRSPRPPRQARHLYFPRLAALIARHTFSEVAGICTYGAPIWASASLTAFITDDNAPTVPDSPAPLTPRGLVLVGTSFSPNVNVQK